MSATLGAALKKIAVALLTDRRNWEKLAVALFKIGRASCRERV